MAGQDDIPGPMMKLIRRNAWVAVAAFLVVLIGISLWERNQGPPPADIGGPFALTDQNGKAVTDKTFRGKFELIYFGFTHCPDACPTTLTLIGAALKKLPPADAKKIQPIFITLDPERDTPPVMKEYVDYFMPGMEGLTGSTEAIADVARAFRVSYQKVKDPNSDQPYTIDHSSIIYVMDGKGRFIKNFSAGITPDSLAAELEKIL